MKAADLPEGVKGVEVLRLEPGDVLVLSCEHELKESAIANLSDNLTKCFPGTKCAVLYPGMKMSVVRNGDADGLHAMPAAEGT